MRTSWIAAIVAVVVGISVTVQGPTASAQIPLPPNPSPTNRVPLATPQRGDTVYAFSDEQPWNDPRVGLALAVMIDQQLTASVRGHILPANEQLRVASAPDQALQLLAAAGYPGRSPFRELRPCKLWAAPPPVDVQVAVPYGQAAKEFEAAFLAAMGQLGVTANPCEIVPTPDQAHILLWYQGGPAPAIPKRSTATFLAPNLIIRDFPRVPVAPVDGNSPPLETSKSPMYQFGLAAAALLLVGSALVGVRRLRGAGRG